MEILTPKFFVLNCKYIVPSMTYERYLIEVVNGSLDFFAHKRRITEQFRLHESQSKGEDDAFSSLYSMDFKLLVNQEFMNSMAKNKPEVDYSHMKDGFVFVSKKNRTPIIDNNIIFDLMTLKKEDIDKNQLDDTVSNVLKNLRKSKNLFLYYPYEFQSSSDYSYTCFESFLNDALKTIMEYRTEKQPSKDTFICIKNNKWFLIYEWTSNGFVFRDNVHEILCANYRDVKLYSVH